MTFYEEPTYYLKTILSDLQGSWEDLRQTVVEKHPFPKSDRLLFHIDEAMSWESVRNLAQMSSTLLLIRNICTMNSVPEEVSECVEDIFEILKELIERDGK